MKRGYSLLFLLFFIPFYLYAAGVKLTDVQVFSFDRYTRLIFSLSGPFKHNCFSLAGPNRIVVDFASAEMATKIHPARFQNKVIQSIRVGAKSSKQVRVVFDLKQPVRKAVYFQKPRGRFGYRLMIDLIPKVSPTSHLKRSDQPVKPACKNSEQKKSAPIVTCQKTNQKEKQPAKKQGKKKAASSIAKEVIAPIQKVVLKAKNKPQRNAVVVIDAGHGGKDPGAVGSRGTKEKEVVLAVVRELRTMLQKTPGVNVYLTRSGNYFVPLRGRLRLARKGTSDLFISVHADAYKDKQASGASVFALSQRGATSEAARWLARKENASELMGGVDLTDKSHLLRSVLLDLSQTATIQSSLKLGNNILQQLKNVTSTHRPYVEQAPFVVLKSPDIPSVLVEIGFISNRDEELRLRDLAYQHKIALALKEGIMDYLRHQRLLPDTDRRSHVVKRGEHLTLIAKEYGVELIELKKINHLKGSTLQVGQILQIP